MVQYLAQAILSLDQSPGRCPIASESADPKRPVRVLHYGRARHVYRVLFWIDSADRNFFECLLKIAPAKK